MSGAIEDPPETKRREWRRPRVGSGGMKPTTVVVVERVTHARKIICKCHKTAEVKKYSRSDATEISEAQ